MAEKDHWLEVSLTTSSELAEAVAEVMSRFVANGVVIESETVFNASEQEHQPTGNMRVFGYLPIDEAIEDKRQALEESLWHLSFIQTLPTPVFKPIQDQNWMTAWRKNYQPLKIGEKILILPAWLEAEKDEKRIIVRIDPAQAFGTGTHPSTQLCLQAVELLTQPGQNVIDLGCGSGILAIAALKFGAAHALAVDIDELSVEATLQNAEINGITNHLEVGKGSLQEVLDGNFSIKEAPLVLVNILAPVIVKLFEGGLAELVSPGGKMVLAGILENQAELVLEAVGKAGLTLERKLQAEDWVGLIVKR
ncbi:MAG: 50S ribosomal protein L11 methyltransferase [Anaerolineaceae bacterium]|nr:50S ribosomal protein L11 methyltransferase [Anaerolineaceae bacterium]